jgi:hypothetical protein
VLFGLPVQVRKLSSQKLFGEVAQEVAAQEKGGRRAGHGPDHVANRPEILAEDQRSGRGERGRGQRQHPDRVEQDENRRRENPRGADEVVNPRHQLFPSARGQEEAPDGSQKEHIAGDSRKEKEDRYFQEVHFVDGQTLVLRAIFPFYGMPVSKGRRRILVERALPPHLQ